ncbi:hypothetical protein ACFC1R_32535 [Kitasatospora sp. NPDC056138]|uniref:hypothetical protein n=1 Tax=Kitasatospora sp. NPDC056138 TaxID=3345724 RepID=UPI0035DCDDE1
MRSITRVYVSAALACLCALSAACTDKATPGSVPAPSSAPQLADNSMVLRDDSKLLVDKQDTFSFGAVTCEPYTSPGTVKVTGIRETENGRDRAVLLVTVGGTGSSQLQVAIGGGVDKLGCTRTPEAGSIAVDHDTVHVRGVKVSVKHTPPSSAIVDAVLVCPPGKLPSSP